MTDKKPRPVVDRLRTRIDHLNRLADEESGFVIDDANAAFEELYQGGSKPSSILIRSGFLARPKPLRVEGDRDRTERRKPPAADIVRSRGVAFRLELALLFVRQCSARPGARLLPVEAPAEELGLINLFATGTRRRGESAYQKRRPSMRAAQVRNALDILGHRRLVELGPSSEGRSPYAKMWLNNEAGPAPGKDPSRYTPPTASDATVSVPVEFFTHGWIQVLTDSEMWNWLTFRHVAGMSTATSPPGQGVQLHAVNRLNIYDLTRDAWDTHMMLDRLGLMTTIPGEITSELTEAGKQRFNKEHHKFDLDDSVLKKPAHAAVLAAVSEVLDNALGDAGS